MRSPEKILNSLMTYSRQSDYKSEGLYRLLFNERMYHVACQCTYVKRDSMTKSADNKDINRMSIARIRKLTVSLKDEIYQSVPSRRVYVPKRNGKKRPLGISTFNDKLLQEVIKTTLEIIYEDSFDTNSHGFRPKRSYHTALRQTQQTFNRTRWFIEGDIKGFSDNINHGMMITISRRRIADEQFLRLVHKLLNVDYIKSQTFHKTYSGTP